MPSLRSLKCTLSCRAAAQLLAPALALRLPPADWMMDAIAEREGKAERSLMHRFDICRVRNHSNASLFCHAELPATQHSTTRNCSQNAYCLVKSCLIAPLLG